MVTAMPISESDAHLETHDVEVQGVVIVEGAADGVDESCLESPVLSRPWQMSNAV